MSRLLQAWRLPGMAIAFILLLPGALAQTASVEGTVRGPDGVGVGGASVIATNTANGLVRTADSNAAGNFFLRALPPGPYKIEAAATGLFAAPLEVALRIGQTGVVDFKMAAEQVEQITVTAERPILNTTSSQVSTVVTPEYIEQLPLINRDFTDLAALAPGAKPKPTGQVDPTKNEAIYRPFTIGAGNGREVNIQIDGGDNNDNAVGTFTMGLSLDAIQEFEIVTDQYRAEYGRASHGVVNVLTKSGTNNFSGTVFGLYRDDGFRQRNFSERLAGADKADSERKQYGFSVGGPFVRDRFFGFLNYEKIDEESPVAYSPLLTAFARTSAFAGRSFAQGPDRDLYTAKVNWNIDKNNTAFLRYAKDDNTFSNDQGGSLTLEPFNGFSFNDVFSVLGNWTLAHRQWVNELRIHRTEFENGIQSNTDAGSVDFITTQGYDLFSLGRNRNTPQATIQSKTQIRNDFSWIVGNHDLKFGVDYIDLEFDDSFLGLPNLPTVNFAFQTGVTPDDIDATPGDLALIDEIFFDNPGFIPGTDYQQIGLYAQDNWRISDRWTVYYGLRFDTDSGLFDHQKEGINRTFYQAVASSTVPDRPTFGRTFPEDPKTWSPRAGFVYRLNGEDTDVLRGSWGLFHDKVIENLTIFSTQNLSPVFFPSLPNLDCATGGVINPDCQAGFDPDGPGGVDPLPQDFTFANWFDPNPANPLRGWYQDLVSILGPLTTFDAQQLFIPSPDWKMPFTRSYSFAWGHRFNNEWASDVTAIYSDGARQLRIWDVRGTPGGTRNTGIVPATTASREFYFTTDGRTEYISLQTQLRATKPKYTLTFNVNLSRARGTQDTGASANESGTVDIFSGGNRRYTGPDPSFNRFCNSATPHGNPAIFGSGPTCSTERQEFGPISGDQTVWIAVSYLRRLPAGFTVSGDLSYGSEVAFWPNAGYDQNRDGFNSGSEYLGSAGSGQGDDFFSANVRVTKKFQLARGATLDLFGEVFNLTNHTNYGLFVDQRQANQIAFLNEGYLRPTGGFLGQPRTINAGFRLAF